MDERGPGQAFMTNPLDPNARPSSGAEMRTPKFRRIRKPKRVEGIDLGRLIDLAERKSSRHKMRYEPKAPSGAQTSKKFKLARAALNDLSAALEGTARQKIDYMAGQLISIERGT